MSGQETEAPPTTGDTAATTGDTAATEPTTESAPEAPAPAEASQPAPDVSKCNIEGNGTFDKGVADMKLTETSDIDLERTQLLILVKDGNQYTYTRTKIQPLN